MRQRSNQRVNTHINKSSSSVVKSTGTSLLHHLAAHIFVQVEEDISAPLVALAEDVGLADAVDPTVVVVEPLVAAQTVHVGDVVTRVGGAAEVADHAHQAICVTPSQVHRVP